ncbi:hypothetical protein HNV12_22415 [Methanococcoides sp. SA1]|nr:hypothetical protein [Methanococcoides sp. SA1]
MLSNSKKISNKYRDILIITGIMVLLSLIIGVLIYLLPDQRRAHEDIHSVLETLGSIASISIAFFYLQMKDKTLDWKDIGIISCFLALGVLNIAHSVVDPGQAFVFLHSLATFLGAIGISFIWVPQKRNKLIFKSFHIYLYLALLIFISILSIAFEELLPLMIVKDEFTYAAKFLNFSGGILFLLASIRLYYLSNGSLELTMISLVSLLLGFGGLTFTHSEIWDVSWWIWHIFNAFSYLIVFFIIVQNIISLQKKSELQLLEIKKINKKLNDYSYTISHDLKEPIRSIRTFSQFIQEDYADKLDEEGIDYLSRIIKASSRMASMIDDLLELSRVGRTDIEFSSVSASKLLEDVKSELIQKIKETNTSITTGHLPKIVCQPVWIQSVLRNLIINAIKYGNPKKTEISIKCSETDTHYEFFVTDNGQGIEKEQHEKIFGLFRRATGAKDQEGSGAGLAIVSAVIDEHKGSIRVEHSEVGVGTTIKFTIAKNLEIK